MRNIGFYTKVGIALLSLLLVAVAWLARTVSSNKNISNPNPLTHYAIENHMVILVVLIVVSIAYGFLWSSLSYHEIMEKRRTSKSILDTVLMFLNSNEKSIIQLLIQQKGVTTQAEVSRLPGLNRVKAFRLLQNMKNKNIVEVVPHGKVRKVLLKDDIMKALLETQ